LMHEEMLLFDHSCVLIPRRIVCGSTAVQAVPLLAAFRSDKNWNQLVPLLPNFVLSPRPTLEAWWEARPSHDGSSFS
jgi:hypothetical protein